MKRLLLTILLVTVLAGCVTIKPESSVTETELEILRAQAEAARVEAYRSHDNADYKSGLTIGVLGGVNCILLFLLFGGGAFVFAAVINLYNAARGGRIRITKPKPGDRFDAVNGEVIEAAEPPKRFKSIGGGRFKEIEDTQITKRGRR